MDEAETKTCPMCSEPVRPAARKCPHCHHYLNKWTLAAYHPLIAVSPMLVAFGISLFLFSRVFNHGENFETYRSQIRVTLSEMQPGNLPTSPTIAVVGTVHNDSPIAWRELAIEVQFFDKTHKLIDAKQRQDYITLPSGGDCAFKVSQPREFDLADYATYEVRVIGGKDVRGFP